MKQLILKVFLFTVFLYTGGYVILSAMDALDSGTSCPDGYAIKISGGKYLKCEHFEQYYETEGDDGTVPKGWTLGAEVIMQIDRSPGGSDGR